MIQHGMGAVLDDASSDGIVPGFDPAAGWRKVMDAYLHCPAR